MAYVKPLAGFCAVTAVFVCSLRGGPQPPLRVPVASGVLSAGVGLGGPVGVVQGGLLRVSGGGFRSGADVTVGIYSTPVVLGQFVASSLGVVSGSVVVPQSLVGVHTVVALGNGPTGRPVSLELPVVVSAVTASSAASLAFTGFELSGWILAGLVALVSGLVLVRWSRSVGRAAKSRG